MTVTAQGVATAADVDDIQARIVQAQAMPYGKLYDLRGVTVDLSASDLAAHAGKLAAYRSTGGVGPLALLVDLTTTIDPSVVAAIAAVPRPCRLFEEPAKALGWLRSLQPEPAAQAAKAPGSGRTRTDASGMG